MDKNEINTDEKKVKRTFVNIKGEEFQAQVVVDFLEKLIETDPMYTVTWKRKYEEIAKLLEKEDLVVQNNRGSWFTPKDKKEEIKDIYEYVKELLYTNDN